MKKEKLLIFIVAYNHEKTIENVVNRIPKKLFNLYDLEILIIDDASRDSTFIISKEIKKKYKKKKSFKINIFYNPINQGYGGNQKIGYHYAIKNKFRYVVLLHGDGQYAPEVLPKLLNQISLKNCDVVMGSRMIDKKLALKGGIDGLDLVRKIIYKSKILLKKKGLLALEINNNQYNGVKSILESSGYRIIDKIKDFESNIRCIISTKL